MKSHIDITHRGVVLNCFIEDNRLWEAVPTDIENKEEALVWINELIGEGKRWDEFIESIYDKAMAAFCGSQIDQAMVQGKIEEEMLRRSE